MLQGPKPTQSRARKLRKDMSFPEVLLWQRLKRRLGGVKFRRQHPAGPYVRDFYCHESRLAVEIDGIAHDMADWPARDVRRDEYIKGLGLRMIRIPAENVVRNADEAAEAIVKAATFPPRAGEAA
ncbi:endonuclease domain-containing protein [Altererythrobacter sp. CC-YST694]|uniref:endonuclease domain-containing protein n=1 Tax=Altererythrobacter sp. CC-YST694 TaxID=2755038 RepID=UPI001D013B29|nr:DUF559 domain-containing protein [Altererythrobacter sp. CC-YST694]MCB5424853.1 endonuclease domain-containing protein [Altererythrobacter sp. CC-YST694]